MKPFPPAANLNFLLGRRLSAVSQALYHVAFHFDDDVFIIVEYVFDVRQGTVTYLHDVLAGLDTVRILPLLERQVQKVEVDQLALSLQFDDDLVLTIHTRFGPFESGHIGRKGDLIIF
ncbi:hypothetical protein [Ferrovibrio sp.]|uniref:hypothetical protein n=1 Tax=Ferrovibrio sp. TaxID=1917215 RepID=UPI003D27E97E